MEITLTNVDHWCPNILGLLESDFQVPLYYLDHELRHPLAIFNISYSTVIEKFHGVVGALYQAAIEKPFLDPSKYTWDNQLLANQKDLLYALMEYYEDCENILACFIHPNEKRSENQQFKQFKKNTKEYRDHIGKVVNTIKHRQGRLRSIVILNDQIAMPGYYIEGPLAENTIGPDQVVHPGGKGAFSFARDLRYHFFNFYGVAEFLAKAIKNIIGTSYTPGSNKTERPNLHILELAKGIAEIPLAFYPDEIVKPVPTVVVGFKDDEHNILLTYPNERIHPLPKTSHLKILVSYKGDGVTKSFRFPYKTIDKKIKVTSNSSKLEENE